MSTSADGSGGSGSSENWTPAAKADTTPEAAVAEHDAWMRMAPGERLERMLARQRINNELRFAGLRMAHPTATRGELMALYIEETYRGTVDPDFLARACEATRRFHDGEQADGR